MEWNINMSVIQHLLRNYSLPNTFIIFIVIKIIEDKNYDRTVFIEESKEICACFNLVLHF